MDESTKTRFLCLLGFVYPAVCGADEIVVEYTQTVIFRQKINKKPDSSLMSASNPVLGYMKQTFWSKYNVFT